MSKELSPKYNPAEVEAGRYQKWLDADVFKPSGDHISLPLRPWMTSVKN